MRHPKKFQSRIYYEMLSFVTGTQKHANEETRLLADNTKTEYILEKIRLASSVWQLHGVQHFPITIRNHLSV